jgi:hypothetical protein
MELQGQVTSLGDIGLCVETEGKEQKRRLLHSQSVGCDDSFESRTNYVSKLQHKRVMNDGFSAEYW